MKAGRVGVGLVMLSEAEASLGDRPAKKPRRFFPSPSGRGAGGEGWRGACGVGLVMLSEAEASLGDRPAKKPRRFSPLPMAGEGPGVRVGGGAAVSSAPVVLTFGHRAAGTATQHKEALSWQSSIPTPTWSKPTEPWDFIPPSDQHLRPVMITKPDDSGNDVRYWEIDGAIRGTVRQPVGKREEWDPTRIAPDMAASQAASGRKLATPDASKHMEDVGARLRHMDELGIDYQMLYPTIFLRKLADRDETRVALAKGYNRWMADIWTQSEGRLRWAAVLPLSVMDESIKELRWAAEHGANGVFMRGVEEEGVLQDPYFFPLYEEMSKLDMAVTVHIGNGNPLVENLLNHGAGGSPFSSMRIFSVAACHAWVLAGIPQQFPKAAHRVRGGRGAVGALRRERPPATFPRQARQNPRRTTSSPRTASG